MKGNPLKCPYSGERCGVLCVEKHAFHHNTEEMNATKMETELPADGARGFTATAGRGKRSSRGRPAKP